MRGPRRSGGMVGVICGGLVMLLLAGSAQAAFPGNNGKIAFGRSNGQVWRMNADGSAQELLATSARHPVWSSNGARIAVLGPDVNDISTMNPDGTNQTLACGNCPAGSVNAGLTWSPDATMFAFYSPVDSASATIHRVNADGTGLVALTSTGRNENPAWSPDGTKIAFSSDRFPAGIWVMNADGTDQHGILPAGSPAAGYPAWSPDGTKIAYARVASAPAGGVSVVNADGTNNTAITTNESGVRDVEWSPDGTKIVYQAQGIIVMNADGTERTAVTSATERAPDWQPVPPGYIRPAGATPVRLSLVPSYRECTSPNRDHGTPLAFGSCAPPQRSSAFLTVGTAESNGAPTASTGFLRAETVVGIPSTQTDEADVLLTLSMSDVRLASDLTDYAGELRATMSLRLTDRDNTPFSAAPGTMIDHQLSVDTTCTPTGGSAGSNCLTQTSADALVPSTVKEGRRMVMELGPARVFDGGPDGDTSTDDNTLFATSGLFVP